jgi:hypothetical protein
MGVAARESRGYRASGDSPMEKASSAHVLQVGNENVSGLLGSCVAPPHVFQVGSEKSTQPVLGPRSKYHFLGTTFSRKYPLFPGPLKKVPLSGRVPLFGRVPKKKWYSPVDKINVYVTQLWVDGTPAVFKAELKVTSLESVTWKPGSRHAMQKMQTPDVP